MEIYVELQCEHCKKTKLSIEDFISFATSIEKIYKCPYCGQISKSRWIELHPGYAQQIIMNNYLDNKHKLACQILKCH